MYGWVIPLSHFSSNGRLFSGPLQYVRRGSLDPLHIPNPGHTVILIRGTRIYRGLSYAYTHTHRADLRHVRVLYRCGIYSSTLTRVLFEDHIS